MSCRLLNTELSVVNIRTRIPFRYGIAVVTAVPHLIARITAEIDGRAVHGFSAENLAPKWFTKNPEETYEHEVEDMFRVIRNAAFVAEQAGCLPNVFSLWEQVYQEQASWGKSQGLPLLLLQFGVSVIERAMIDAHCRATQSTFAQALDSGSLGVRLEAIHPELKGANPIDFLPSSPLTEIAVRHTVGMADPLTPAEVADRVNDGLPWDLSALIGRYGVRYFKLKVGGNVDKDTERLTQIIDVIRQNRGLDFHFTIDGNEQYPSMQLVRELWLRLQSGLGEKTMERLLFIEQPLHRDATLNDEVRTTLVEWIGHPPVVIDESDAGFTAVRTALSLGYCGTSHKNCKGIFKGIANACLLADRQRKTGQTTMLSGEDLTNVGPIALLEDLCVMARLGVSHVERNGYHYIKGMTFLPKEAQELTLANHPDVFVRSTEGYPTLQIDQGMIKLGSLQNASLGMAAEFDPTWSTPYEKWSFKSLQL